MATRKHKNFEFAGFSGGKDLDGNNFQAFGAFDTPNGHAFAVVGNDRNDSAEGRLSDIVLERLKYYLEIEDEADPAEAVRNALVYVNGYLHTLGRKNPDNRPGELSCLCALFRDRKVYYAWAGQVCLQLFTGRKLVPLSWDVFRDRPDDDTGRPWEMAFLGAEQFLNPGTCKQPLEPADGDLLILGSGDYCLDPDEKHIRKVLSDNMPTHTKAQRLVIKSGREEEEGPAAVLLVGFYNLGQDTRSFLPGEAPAAARPTGKEEKGPSGPGPLGMRSLLWKALVIIAAVFVVYMVYDMFFFNPRPARNIELVESPADTLATEDSLSAAGMPPQEALSGEPPSGQEPEPPAAREAGASPPALPADREYPVRSGDTWGSIYREFEVCSWFIRNHPPNAGKFDRSNNPVAGTILAIPVMYSASQGLNPHYYTEFTTDKVGASCQHANRAFLRRFEESIRR